MKTLAIWGCVFFTPQKFTFIVTVAAPQLFHVWATYLIFFIMWFAGIGIWVGVAEGVAINGCVGTIIFVKSVVVFNAGVG